MIEDAAHQRNKLAYGFYGHKKKFAILSFAGREADWPAEGLDATKDRASCRATEFFAERALAIA